MKPNFRTCPQCSTRNRLDKEFCVKCGEPLDGVKAGDPALAPTLVGKKGKPGFSVSMEGDEAQSPLIPFISVVLTLALAFGAWQVVRTSDATEAAPARAAGPRVQASIPPAATTAMSPGVEAYTAGMAALRANDFQTAIARLREAVAAASRADFRLGLAEALEKSGGIADGLREYEAAAGIEPANARYTGEWAKALNRAGRTGEAVQAYETAIQLDGANVANLRELANIHLRNDSFDKARPHLERIVALEPDDLTPKLNLARALDAVRDLSAAGQQYQAILTAMPRADLARALYSDVLMRQDRPADAMALLDEGLRLDANAAILHREKGRVFDRQGRNAEAVAAYREYVRLSPGASDIRTFTDRINQLSAGAGQ